jgi:uncharacterized membrane protein
MDRDSSVRTFRPVAVVGGLILLALGAALLLDRSGMVHIDGYLIAPLVLIVMGAAMTFEGTSVASFAPERDETGDIRRRCRRRRMPGGGLWLIGIGVWMFISQNRIWGLGFDTSWPLFLVFIGLMMVVRGSR